MNGNTYPLWVSLFCGLRSWKHKTGEMNLGTSIPRPLLPDWQCNVINCSWPCHCDFPIITGHNLKLWDNTNSSFLMLLFLGYFITATGQTSDIEINVKDSATNSPAKMVKDLNRQAFKRRHTNDQQIIWKILNITNH